MPQRKFQATEGLLSDVMRKQSGVIEKAWLEALMNSVDANATEVNFDITQERTVITDNGDSMTSDEVEKYFEQFGLKDDDIQDKEFGKFRMGRGQVFNFGVNIWRAKQNYMVVSLDDGQVSVSLPDCTTEDDESIVEVDGDRYNLNTEGLSYALLDAEEVDEGLTIEIQHYNPIDDLEGTVREFRNYARFVPWVHGVDVTINGEELDSEPDVVAETDNAWYCSGDSTTRTSSIIYNKGAKVDTFNLGPRRLIIITKNDLDVTLDRTDILDTDQYWQTIQDEYDTVVTNTLVDDNDLTSKERNWLLEKAASDPQVLTLIEDKPLLKDVTNDYWTIRELAGRDIGFGDAGDTVAQDVMQKGSAVMLSTTHEDALKEFADAAEEHISGSNVKEYSEVVEDNLAFEMEERDEAKLNKSQSRNLRVFRRVLRDLGYTGEVKPGYSNHKDVWKDDEGTLYVDTNFINTSKKKAYSEVIFQVIKIAAHDGDTRGGMSEGYGMAKSFYRMMAGNNFNADADFGEVMLKLQSRDYE